MLKSYCGGAVKYSPLYKVSCIFLCMHHASWRLLKQELWGPEAEAL